MASNKKTAKKSNKTEKNSTKFENDTTSEKRKKEKHKRFYSNRELSKIGIHTKLTPISSKSISDLDEETRQSLSITTKAYVPSSMIKILIGLAVATGLIIFCVTRYKMADNLNLHIAYIVGIIVIAIATSFILLKSSQTLKGYCSVRDGWHDWIDVLSSLFYIIGMIVVTPAEMFATLFQGQARVKYIEMIRLALPYGMGVDDAIKRGEKLDSWASLSETLKRIDEGDDYTFYE